MRSTAADPKWFIGMFVFWNNMEFWNVRILWKWNIGIVVTCWFSLVSLSFEYIHICNNCHLIRKWNTDTSNCKLLFIRRIDDLYLLKCLVPEILLGALLSVKMSLGCCYQRIGLTRVIVGKNLHKNMCVCKYTCMYTFTLVCVLIHRVGHRHIFFIVNCHVARWPWGSKKMDNIL